VVTAVASLLGVLALVGSCLPFVAPALCGFVGMAVSALGIAVGLVEIPPRGAARGLRFGALALNLVGFLLGIGLAGGLIERHLLDLLDGLGR
jgi:hypothetical protein